MSSESDDDGLRFFKDEDHIRIENEDRVSYKLFSKVQINGADVNFKKSDYIDATKVFNYEKHVENKVASPYKDAMALFLILSSLDKLTGANKRSEAIEKPPGYGLSKVLRCFLSRKQFERTFGQAIADAREEHYAALAEKDEAEANKLRRELNIIIMRICVELILGWPANLVSSFFGKVFGKGE